MYDSKAHQFLFEGVRKEPKNFPDMNLLGKFLGSGVVGYVFAYGNQKVLKYSGLNILMQEDLDKFEKLQKEEPVHVAKIFQFKKLQFGGFWYLSERLYSLSEKERGSFNRLLDNFYYKSKKIKKCDLQSEMEIRIANFLNKLDKSQIHHSDLHSANICKNKYGKYKLIDLEDIYFKN